MSATNGGSGSGDGLAGLFLGLFVGGIFVLDQHNKRQKEQEFNRQSLNALRLELDQKAVQLEELKARLDPKNEQIRQLAAEVMRLRNLVQLAEKRRVA